MPLTQADVREVNKLTISELKEELRRAGHLMLDGWSKEELRNEVLNERNLENKQRLART